MSYIAPQIQEKFDSLSQSLKEKILIRDVRLNTLQDLINVLGEIVKEAEE